ncbi:type III secretion system chaperone [Vibrio sp. S4M6]|uniref:type III secretion system chaperone n=1 Tax=Vibrio sinus TaxID=2946865 RepID=UPI00202A8D62|nr:type III secretion system chaperone [Vibrio sinus]MCL9781846.1 type III secretion system chaperone [Vibrio sinus]
MNIYEELLSGLGKDISFNEEGIFSRELKKEGAENLPLLLTIYNDMQDMSFRISVMSLRALSNNLSPQLMQAFIEKSLEPLRGGIGIGVYPDTRYLTVYQTLPLAGSNKDVVMEVITSLVDEAESWLIKLRENEMNMGCELVEYGSEAKFGGVMNLCV